MSLKDNATELNNIKDLLVDSQKGYFQAAERVEDEPLTAVLLHLSESRTSLLTDVDRLIQRADPEAAPLDGGTIKGDLHRTRMEVRDALSSSDNANVLAECERGEEFLAMRYDEVLKKDDLDPAARSTLSQQRAIVQGNLDRVRQLHKGYKRVES